MKYNIGDKVWVECREWEPSVENKPVGPVRYIGPCTIIKFNKAYSLVMLYVAPEMEVLRWLLSLV
jgi:hypothetical protein